MKNTIDSVYHLQTPCYIINYDVLNNNVTKLKQALQANFKSSIFSYSVKTNSLPWLLQYLKDENCFAEVVSEDEYMLAVELGFVNGNIVYNGPLKSKKTFFDALSKSSIVNIDTKRELLWVDEFISHKKISAKIGLRLNVDMESLLPGAADYPDDGSRFGFSIENDEFENAFLYLKSKGIDLLGLHLHRTTKLRSIDGYKKLCKFAIDVAKKYELDLEYIDIGGGFYGDKPNSPTYGDYFSAIKNELERHFDMSRLTVIVEPGNAVVASCFDFLVSVIDTKKIKEHRIVTVDGSRNDIDPFFHKNSYFYEIYANSADCATSNVVSRQIIAGCSCLEYDRVFELLNSSELKIDNKILFKFVGAYTMTLSPLFIRLFPKVYVYKNNKYILVRPKWSYKSLMLNV